MRGLSYDPGILPSEMIIRHRFKPINDIPREEMLARKSFPSVKEVKIYTIVSDQLSPPITGESFCTDMVRHSDYAELEDKYAALAADNDKAMESLKQADAAVKLAHEKFSALAAENAELKQSEKEFNNFCRQEYYGWEDNFTETPATDAFLAEIERKAIRKFINSIEHILRDKLSPYDTEEMLESMRIFLEEQGGEQK
ncbi:DUF2737 family protein [Salmonella enterica subsp. enterica serovar Agona]|uniref:DUF2737 domain-containing protein n=6 Tax=Salmonella enterica TaxID=28901 RepID=A0A3V4IFH3_SALET|nr:MULTISPECIES: DUF2737 family protein [Salmonella]EAA0899388.1 DUF2737 domain-containing protein [Salmonella enterica subsp. enterica serovar Stanley]EAA4418014.1 DUF2737 family protein [Salmonella enterica subsp. enterica serovar Oranienburg]EAC0195262.1 DUF2737 family protein [Salmonella enterica subsp. enterica serovar Panama]EBH8234165.1 DUF2737 family protein [Salmonella enterica subsp. enterica serovar Agona str. SL483]EBS5025798.1 DUF2737 family protein [Salmonella enterica subsp. ent